MSMLLTGHLIEPLTRLSTDRCGASGGRAGKVAPSTPPTARLYGMVRLVPSRCGACRRAHSLSPVPTLSVSTLARSDRHRTPPPSRLRCPRPSPPRHPRPACGRGRADCILAHQARRAKAHAERRENQQPDSRRRGAWHARWRARRWVQNKRHTHLFVGIVLVVCNRRVVVSRRRVGPPLATDNWQVKIELAHHFELTKKKVDMQREREIEACLENMREVGAKKRARHRAQVHFQVVLSVFLLRSRTCC